MGGEGMKRAEMRRLQLLVSTGDADSGSRMYHTSRLMFHAPHRCSSRMRMARVFTGGRWRGRSKQGRQCPPSSRVEKRHTASSGSSMKKVVLHCFQGRDFSLLASIIAATVAGWATPLYTSSEGLVKMLGPRPHLFSKDKARAFV